MVALYRRDIWPDLIYKMLVMVGALCRRDIGPALSNLQDGGGPLMDGHGALIHLKMEAVMAKEIEQAGPGFGTRQAEDLELCTTLRTSLLVPSRKGNLVSIKHEATNKLFSFAKKNVADN